MRAFRILLVAAIAVAASALPAAAEAKLSATIVAQPDGKATRIVATITSSTAIKERERPRSARFTAKGTTYALTRATSTPAGAVAVLRTAKLTGKRQRAAQSLIGRRVRLTVVTRAGRSTIRSTITTPAAAPVSPVPVAAPPAGTNPAPAPTAPAGTGTPAPLFTPPATALTGTPAYDAIKGYVADATLTTCVAGWPNCAVEHRYSIAADSTFYYCRLTSNAGSDITSVGAVTSIVGAEQTTDGAWGLSFQETSYGYTHQYTWRVAADGSASVQYWDGSGSFAGPPTSTEAGFTWVRGAKTCAY